MRLLVQGVCVLAIALGAGLFSFGSYQSPRQDSTNPADLARYFDSRNYNERREASATRGVGIGLMTLGVLGVAVPWVNALVFRQRGQGPVASVPSAPPA